jgi:hypothetical protein
MNRGPYDGLVGIFAMFVVFPLVILHRESLDKAIVLGWTTLVLAGVLWVGQKFRDNFGRWLQLGAALGWLLFVGFAHAIGAI